MEPASWQSLLRLDTQTLLVTILIPGFVLLFLLYHFLTASDWYRELFSRCRSERTCEVARVLAKRAIFVTSVAIIPLGTLLIVGDVSLGWLRILPLFSMRSVYWVLAITGGMSLFSLVAGNSRAARRNYPIIRFREWTYSTHFLNVGSWAVYLAAYEFAYRGYVLFLSAEALGTWPAIAISVALYAALHIPRGAAEALGCVPMGVVFALAAMHTGTIWVPFLAHFLSAVVNDLLTFHRNPQFSMVRNGSRQHSGL